MEDPPIRRTDLARLSSAVLVASLAWGCLAPDTDDAATSKHGFGSFEPRVESGTLALGDDVLEQGEYVDWVEFEGRSGERAWIDLRSEDFDTYLMLFGPDTNDALLQNDDYLADTGRSVVYLELPADGRYEVAVTSLEGGETGAWSLQIFEGFEIAAPMRTERGELRDGDATLATGEFVDEIRFEAMAGQELRLSLTSPDFDTYLVLIDPLGEHLENDDDDDGGSSLVTRLPEAGTYQVLVTSFEPNESGDYTLSIDLGDVRAPAEVVWLELEEEVAGRLEPGDDLRTFSQYSDRYHFQANAGTPVELVLASQELDTFLQLEFPDGTLLENDDDWDREGRSRIELTLPQTGVYKVSASSYDSLEQGEYLLRLGTSVSSIPPPLRGAPERTLALLVGISHYGGRASDLENTAKDARLLRQALVERTEIEVSDTRLLVDSEATAAAFREALAELAARMSAADQLVIFFSGHGDRVRRDEFQSADPDAVDETLSLYDEELLDDELARLLDDVPGRVLLVLDSCFAGGFAKDVISRPGRMGLFSSEEDVTSSVAEKFRAGGFLAAFLTRALDRGDWADDGDGQLTTLELSHYLHERYRTDVKGGSGPDDFVRTEGPLLGYQRLVVDRGSLTDVLFTLR